LLSPQPSMLCKVCTIEDAYGVRLAKLHEVVATQLVPKVARLEEVRGLVGARLSEVRGAGEAVERETIMDCEAILERLRAAVAVKLSSLTQVAPTASSSLVSKSHHLD
jgi:hypothetical protein